MTAVVMTAADSIVYRAAYGRMMSRTHREGPVLRGKQCLVFEGAISSNGYGEVRVGRRVMSAHKLAWIARHGLLPERMHVLHHCDNPPCLEDEHHFVGDHDANMRDMKRKGRGRGKQLTPAQVREIRQASAAGERTLSIAARFRVSTRTIIRIVGGKAWSKVK